MRAFRSLRTRGIAALVVTTLGAGLVAAAAKDQPGPRFTSRQLSLPTAPGVVIDATLFVPVTATGRHPAPAVIVGHGFGGDKNDVRADAEDLARHGYVVLTPSSRGFGRSTGDIGLDLPQYDGVDLRAEIDYLATQPQVLLDGPGDPRVGIAGASYGGGLALLGAGHDRRVDADVAVITWNSLASALAPNAADPTGGRRIPGVFKALYAGALFGSGIGPAPGSAGADGAGGSGVNPCGRFAPAVCAAYTQASTTTLDPQTLALLDRASVASDLDAVHAPTLLIQGEADTLFPLAEAVRTYTALRARGVTTAMVWADGGHDQPFDKATTAVLRARTRQWFDVHLRGSRADAGPGFTWYEPTSGSTSTAAAFPVPGTRGHEYVLGSQGRLSSDGAVGSQQVINPPGGRPAATTSLPGLAGLADLAGAGGLTSNPPEQTAQWTSDPLAAPLTLVGAPRVRIHVASTTGEVLLFGKVYDVSPEGQATLAGGQVAPLRVTGLTAAGRDIDIELPTLARTFAAGHRLRIAFGTTDSAFSAQQRPAVITVAGVAGAGLSIPVAPEGGRGASGLLIGVLVGLAVLVLLAGLARLAIRRNARRAATRTGDPEATPIVVRGLSKVYADGNRAVDDLSFTVERGQVVGLLGPNGSGKTTTLRMVLGLITPTAGETTVFGEQARPGAPVLSRLGTFVEGPGLLPHLTGRENLELWWRSSGARLEDAHLDEALEVAGLGRAVDKPVRTYSHGMKQRLALAQALLGKPDCLILDEPTNGLDPPQIREMRELIQRYAASGRTVLVSSHLLSEVEVTCTHAVVMQSGRLVYAGSVRDLLRESSSVHITVTRDVSAAAALLRGLADVQGVTVAGDELVVDASAQVRPALVRALVAAGFDVEEVAIKRRLEDVFLDLVGASAEGHAVGSGGVLPTTAGRR